MFNKVSLVSLAVLMAACSGGGSTGGDAATPPGTSTPPVSPPGTPPPTTTTNTAPIVTTPQIRVEFDGNLSTTIGVTDAENDDVRLTLVSGPDWVSLSETGELTGTPPLDGMGTFELVIDVSDGTDTTRTTIEVTVFMDPIEQAFRTGDFTYITEHAEHTPPQVLLDEMDAIQARNRAAIIDIYELNPDGTLAENSVAGFNWNPGAASTSAFQPKYPYSFPLLTTNDGRARHIALLGEAEGGRFSVFGQSPINLGAFNANAPKSRLLKNTINWITRADHGEELNVVMAHFPGEFETQRTAEWLDAAFSNHVSNEHGDCDGTRLATCLTDDVDLMILYQNLEDGDEPTRVELIETITEAMNQGVGLIFVRRYTETSELGDDIQTVLGGTGAYATYPFFPGFDNFSPLDSVYSWTFEKIADIESLVDGIEDESYDYDLSICAGPPSCPENPSFNEDAFAKLNNLDLYVTEFNQENQDPFANWTNDRFTAALALTGDYYRDLTSFPIPKASTPSSQIIRAMFGERANVANRTYAPAMPDMGVFSRSVFADIERIEADVTLSGHGPFQSTGLYALPGQPVKITRHDSANSIVKIQINSLSADSDQPFLSVNGEEYRRPNAVNSAPIELQKSIVLAGNNTSVNLDDSIEIVSPFGGPIHVYFDAPNEDIELSFSGVANHPVWRDHTDTERFQIELSADAFDWAELITPYVQLHAKSDEMREAVQAHGTPQNLANEIDTYMYDWPLWLDGRHGEGIRENVDLVAFQTEAGISEPAVYDQIHHWNAGSASCLPACGENPVDSFGAPDPFAYNSQLASGSGLTNDLLLLTPGSDKALAHLYAVHGQYRRQQISGQTVADCQPLPFEDLYALIQDAHASGDPVDAITDDDLRAADRQNALYIQLMAALEQQGAFEDGWRLLPRLNVITRIMDQNLASIRGWNTVRDSIGFAGWAHHIVSVFTPRRQRLIIQLSWASQRDVIAYMEMWGYYMDEGTKSWIRGFGFPELEPVFYAIPSTGHCTGLNHPELPVDGVSTWP